jgi:hypothetical protein
VPHSPGPPRAPPHSNAIRTPRCPVLFFFSSPRTHSVNGAAWRTSRRQAAPLPLFLHEAIHQVRARFTMPLEATIRPEMLWAGPISRFPQLQWSAPLISIIAESSPPVSILFPDHFIEELHGVVGPYDSFLAGDARSGPTARCCLPPPPPCHVWLSPDRLHPVFPYLELQSNSVKLLGRASGHLLASSLVAATAPPVRKLPPPIAPLLPCVTTTTTLLGMLPSPHSCLRHPSHITSSAGAPSWAPSPQRPWPRAARHRAGSARFGRWAEPVGRGLRPKAAQHHRFSPFSASSFFNRNSRNSFTILKCIKMK